MTCPFAEGASRLRTGNTPRAMAIRCNLAIGALRLGRRDRHRRRSAARCSREQPAPGRPTVQASGEPAAEDESGPPEC